MPSVFPISPLIRVTLLCLYIALTLPLPFLAKVTQAPVPPNWLWFGIAIGLLALYAVLCERVVIDETTIQVNYPQWVPRFFRQGWSLAWSDIKDLQARTTGQGGLVYYFVTEKRQAYLLPMRVAGFARMLKLVTEKTGIETASVYPLSQPWMYLILLLFSGLLLLVDAWTINVAINGIA